MPACALLSPGRLPARTFTESVFADRIDFRPKVHPSKDALKKRLKAVKAEIRHERCVRPRACTQYHHIPDSPARGWVQGDAESGDHRPQGARGEA